MNFIDDPQIITPINIQPNYDINSNRLNFQLPITNKHPHPIHFYIASTFGFCLQEQTNIRFIDANSTVTLSFKIKLTNLVGGGIEAVAILASNHKGFEQFPLNNGSKKIIKLIINEDSLADPTILKILEEQAAICYEEASKLKINGEIEKALNKYEQAYEILRTSEKSVNAMIQCRLLQKDYKNAVRDIESMLLLKPNNPHFILAKVKVIMIWQQQAISTNDELFHYIKTSLDFLRDNAYFLILQDQNTYSELVEQFKKYAKITKKQPNKHLFSIYEKALSNFSEELPISKLFPKKEDFETELKSIIIQPNHEDIATPEEIIDPISYEIMKKPLICPSGNSFEEKSLKLYFARNGPKDPITRKQINPYFIYPNLALEKFIRQNPKLKQWQKYEFDFIHS